MHTAEIYRPARSWSIIAAFIAALILEAAALALANFRQSEAVPTAAGLIPPGPIEAAFVVIPPEAPRSPESVAPQLPPPPDLPLEFVIAAPAPRPQTARPAHPAAAPLVARTTSVGLATARARLISAPAPAYPYEARRGRATGNGIFLLRFDAAGEVTDVTVSRSTGHAILDQVSLRTFRGWRCEPGAYAAVYVPVTFSLAGAQL